MACQRIVGRLQGQVALVTGASQGVGRAAALGDSLGTLLLRAAKRNSASGGTRPLGVPLRPTGSYRPSGPPR